MQLYPTFLGYVFTVLFTIFYVTKIAIYGAIMQQRETSRSQIPTEAQLLFSSEDGGDKPKFISPALPWWLFTLTLRWSYTADFQNGA